MSKVQTRSGLGAAISAVQNDSNLDTLAGINEPQTGAYTIIIDDQNRTIEVNSATPVIITLTAIATLLLAAHTSDFQMTIKSIGAGAVTITPTTDTFDDGSATKVLSQYESFTLQTDSTDGKWNVIGSVRLAVPATANNLPMLNSDGEVVDSLIETSGNGSNITTDLKGDVLAADGTSVLDSGTDGSDAVFTGDVTGDVTGNVTGNADTATLADAIVSQGDLATLNTVDTGQLAAQAVQRAKIHTTTLSIAGSIPGYSLGSSVALNAYSFWPQIHAVAGGGAGQSIAGSVTDYGTPDSPRVSFGATGSVGGTYDIDYRYINV